MRYDDEEGLWMAIAIGTVLGFLLHLIANPSVAIALRWLLTGNGP